MIGRGRFWGGTNLLTGQPAYLTTVAPEDGEEIVLNPAGCVRRRDVRSASTKRVASAVGEGAMAVRMIHQHLRFLAG